jgi:hypothetical protein
MFGKNRRESGSDFAAQGLYYHADFGILLIVRIQQWGW